MKSDTERKKFYSEKLHKRKNRLHVHLSKELRSKLKTKKRALLVRKNDRVKVMRGPGKGKDAKVLRVSVLKLRVYLEGIAARNAKGTEIPVGVEPSNLLLIGIEPTDERKAIFREEAFKKEEKKAEAKAPEKQTEGEKKAEPKPAAEHKAEHKAEHTEHRPGEHKAEQKPQNPQHLR